MDVVYLALTILLAALSLGLIGLCQSVKGGQS